MAVCLSCEDTKVRWVTSPPGQQPRNSSDWAPGFPAVKIAGRRVLSRYNQFTSLLTQDFETKFPQLFLFPNWSTKSRRALLDLAIEILGNRAVNLIQTIVGDVWVREK